MFYYLLLSSPRICLCVHTFICVPVFVQSKSASSTDSQPTEERQGTSGGYSSSHGGAEAKRRRCDDKEPLASHSYVCGKKNLLNLKDSDLSQSINQSSMLAINQSSSVTSK